MNRKDNCLDIQNYQFVQLNGKIVHLFSQIFVQFFPVSFLEFNNFEVLFHVFSWILKEILDLCWNLTIQLHLWTVLIFAWPAFLISRISVVSNKIKSENENVVIFFSKEVLTAIETEKCSTTGDHQICFIMFIWLSKTFIAMNPIHFRFNGLGISDCWELSRFLLDWCTEITRIQHV